MYTTTTLDYGELIKVRHNPGGGCGQMSSIEFGDFRIRGNDEQLRDIAKQILAVVPAEVEVDNETAST
jgi:hypothetical protein